MAPSRRTVVPAGSAGSKGVSLNRPMRSLSTAPQPLLPREILPRGLIAAQERATVLEANCK